MVPELGAIVVFTLQCPQGETVQSTSSTGSGTRTTGANNDSVTTRDQRTYTPPRSTSGYDPGRPPRVGFSCYTYGDGGHISRDCPRREESSRTHMTGNGQVSLTGQGRGPQ